MNWAVDFDEINLTTDVELRTASVEVKQRISKEKISRKVSKCSPISGDLYEANFCIILCWKYDYKSIG
jgi:hypothetical protein